MRMTKDDQARIAAAIAPLDKEEIRDLYRRWAEANPGKFGDINKRYRWDLLWKAIDSKVLTYEQAFGFKPEDDHRVGYSGEHVDTALRSIVPALG